MTINSNIDSLRDSKQVRCEFIQGQVHIYLGGRINHRQSGLWNLPWELDCILIEKMGKLQKQATELTKAPRWLLWIILDRMQGSCSVKTRIWEGHWNRWRWKGMVHITQRLAYLDEDCECIFVNSGEREVSFYHNVREINLVRGMMIAKFIVSAVIWQTTSLYGNKFNCVSHLRLKVGFYRSPL